MNLRNEGIGQRTLMLAKLKESALSVLPIIAIVTVLCLTIAPVGTDVMLSFLLGSALVIVGMGLFTIGTETSMTPMGKRLGTTLTKTRRLQLILILSFILGFAVTISEPDLQVLGQTVPHIESWVLIAAVGIGVGAFLALSMLRILMGYRLRWLLLGSYILIFILAALPTRISGVWRLIPAA